MGKNQQQKFRYQASIQTGDGTLVGYHDPEEFQQPETKRMTIAQQHNKSHGQIKIQGMPEYGDLTFKMALEIRDDGAAPASSVALDILQNLANLRYDTCDISLTMLEERNEISFIRTFHNCLIQSVTPDSIGRTQDDSVMYVTIVASPQFITDVTGPQMP